MPRTLLVLFTITIFTFLLFLTYLPSTVYRNFVPTRYFYEWDMRNSFNKILGIAAPSEVKSLYDFLPNSLPTINDEFVSLNVWGEISSLDDREALIDGGWSRTVFFDSSVDPGFGAQSDPLVSYLFSSSLVDDYGGEYGFPAPIYLEDDSDLIEEIEFFTKIRVEDMEFGEYDLPADEYPEHKIYHIGLENSFMHKKLVESSAILKTLSDFGSYYSSPILSDYYGVYYLSCKDLASLPVIYRDGSSYIDLDPEYYVEMFYSDYQDEEDEYGDKVINTKLSTKTSLILSEQIAYFRLLEGSTPTYLDDMNYDSLETDYQLGYQLGNEIEEIESVVGSLFNSRWFSGEVAHEHWDFDPSGYLMIPSLSPFVSSYENYKSIDTFHRFKNSFLDVPSSPNDDYLLFFHFIARMEDEEELVYSFLGAEEPRFTIFNMDFPDSSFFHNTSNVDIFSTDTDSGLEEMEATTRQAESWAGLGTRSILDTWFNVCFVISLASTFIYSKFLRFNMDFSYIFVGSSRKESRKLLYYLSPYFTPIITFLILMGIFYGMYRLLLDLPVRILLREQIKSIFVDFFTKPVLNLDFIPFRKSRSNFNSVKLVAKLHVFDDYSLGRFRAFGFYYAKAEESFYFFESEEIFAQQKPEIFSPNSFEDDSGGLVPDSPDSEFLVDPFFNETAMSIITELDEDSEFEEYIVDSFEEAEETFRHIGEFFEPTLLGSRTTGYSSNVLEYIFLLKLSNRFIYRRMKTDLHSADVILWSLWRRRHIADSLGISKPYDSDEIHMERFNFLCPELYESYFKDELYWPSGSEKSESQRFSEAHVHIGTKLVPIYSEWLKILRNRLNK